MNKKLERFLVLITDFITINLTFLIYYYVRVHSGLFEQPEITEQDFNAFPMFVIYFYWLIIFIFVGMYRTWFATSRIDELSTLIKSSFFGVFVLFFSIFIDDYSEKREISPKLLIIIYWGLLLFLVGGGRLFIRFLQRNLLIKGYGRKNALIAGYNQKGFEVYEEIVNHRALGFDVVGFVTVNEENTGKDYKGIKALGTYKEIDKIIEQTKSKEIIIALKKNNDDEIIELISRCENLNVGLKIVPDLYEILSGQAKTSQLYGFPLIDIMPQLMPEWEKKLKRILDIVVSLIFLALTFPIIILTAIGIKLTSKGPVFYKQERCGLNGEPFKIYKFRSMFVDAETKSGPVWSQKNDPRITPIGRFIRKVRIDELPQMINVLKGEMSLVGPRPERPYFVELLANEIPYYKRRLKVRPGITGWAQVKHKYDESIEDVKIKLRYDLFYIENISIRMDFKILFRTIFVVLFGKGQ